jgi:acetyl-CoA acyltransferase
MQEAYIVAARRTAVGRAKRGTLAETRPDDMAVAVVNDLLATSGIAPEQVEDLILGCAFPEGAQGMNFARQVVLLSGLPAATSALTINRFCSSGLEAIHLAALKVASGTVDCAIAGGAESMTMIPMGGLGFAPNPALTDERPGSYLGMGLTAERVAVEDKISREEQDAFSIESHRRAIAAIAAGKFEEEITPMTVIRTRPTGKGAKSKSTATEFKVDEGPRADSTAEALAKLRPAFQTGGTVTAGNSSQMSDGAAAVLVANADFVKENNLKPLARFAGYVTAGLDPEVMGLGPVYAVPKLIKQTGIALADIGHIELNEAFAAQSLAVLRRLDLDPARVNVHGGAIAMGHPLGCTGAKLSAQILHDMKREKGRYGMVTMCVGGGMGAAGLFELAD